MLAKAHTQKVVLLAAVAAIVACIGLTFIVRPSSPAMWIAATVFGIAALGALTVAMLDGERRKDTFHQRDSLSDDEIFTNYFAELNIPRDIALELWHEVARTLKVPADRLRPADRFGKELGLYVITSEDLDSLAELADARARKKGRSLDLASISTLGEYVQQLSSIGR